MTPRDKVLCELASHGGKLKKSDLKLYTRLKLSELEPILEELARENMIRIGARNMIILKDG